MTDLDVITLEYAGLCSCGSSFAAGEPVGYDRERRTVICSSCLSASSGADAAELAQALSPDAHGRFGAHAIAAMDLAAVRAASTPTTAPAPDSQADAEADSAYHRRHGRDDDSGSLAIRLLGRSEPSDRAASKAASKAASHAADGDRAITETLEELAESGGARILSDRRVPGSRAHIDQLVIAGTGVYVVDAQRYAGAPVAVRQAGGMFGPRRTDLYVRGRQCYDLVHSVERLAAAVRTVLDGTGLTDVPVTPILCLVGGSFPMFKSTLPAGETTVVGLKALRKLLGRSGRLDAEARERVYVSLAASLTAMT